MSSIPVGRTFFVKKEKRKKEEASSQGKNKAMWGEEAKPLKHKNDAERKSPVTFTPRRATPLASAFSPGTL